MATDPKRVAVIMAGGSGERFWPLSRRLRPKQLLKLGDPDRTMLQQALDRIRPLFPADRIFIVTGEHLLEPIRSSKPGIPDENVIAEPAKRNTSGALVFAAATVLARTDGPPDRISMAIFAADHRIEPDDLFRQDVEAALGTAGTDGGLCVIGIPPARPATGYGYIETDGVAPAVGRAVTVRSFREKPDLDTAKVYSASGRHYWNSGMFFWRLDEFLRELAGTAPELAGAVPRLAELIRTGGAAELRRRFEDLPSISIDYALMEKAKTVRMVPARFRWDDLGTWESLRRAQAPDSEGNVTTGDPVLIGTKNSIVVNEPGPGRMAVAVVGLENVVVAVTEDGVLVLAADHSEDVSRVVAELKRRGGKQT